MRLFDSHIHIERLDALGGLDAVLDRARTAGVVKAVAVGGTAALNAAAEAAARHAPDMLAAAIGYDRDQAPAMADDATACDATLRALRERIATLREADSAPVAIGEIGLDYHYAAESAPSQRRLFAAQLALARECQLPVIVHSREADADTVAALREHARLWAGDSARIGVLHCFTGDMPVARNLLDLGLFISFSGIVTFRNADPLRAVAANVPGDRLLIETDSPFLAPVPVRGRQNEPAFVRHVAECLAAVRGVDAEALADSTCANACRLFGLRA